MKLPDRITVHVDWRDIREGTQLHPAECPLAIALGREFPSLWLVAPSMATAFKGNEQVDYRIRRGGAFVVAFDMFRFWAVLWPRTVTLERR